MQICINMLKECSCFQIDYKRSLFLIVAPKQVTCSVKNGGKRVVRTINLYYIIDKSVSSIK